MCFSMNELPEYQREIKYCGYAAYVKEKNIEKLVKAKLWVVYDNFIYAIANTKVFLLLFNIKNYTNND